MKKALFVWGGWDGHEPKQCTDIFAPILEKEGYQVEVSDTLDSYLNKENLLSKDLIVQVLHHGENHQRAAERLAGSRRRRHWALAAGTAESAIPSARAPTTSSWSAGSGWLIRAA